MKITQAKNSMNPKQGEFKDIHVGKHYKLSKPNPEKSEIKRDETIDVQGCFQKKPCRPSMRQRVVFQS